MRGREKEMEMEMEGVKSKKVLVTLKFLRSFIEFGNILVQEYRVE